MAMPKWIAEAWNELSEEKQRQAGNFVRFLMLEQRHEQKEANETISRIQLGVWREEPFYIAEDFDETPADFEAYV